MKVEFTGKTVVVTGAGHGIGRAIARAFADDGASVFACDLDAGELAEASSGRMQTAAFDIADLTGAAFLSVTRPGASRSGFYLVDLDSGKATYLGRIGGGQAVRAMSFEP